jgi:hypothetical protein
LSQQVLHSRMPQPEVSGAIEPRHFKLGSHRRHLTVATDRRKSITHVCCTDHVPPTCRVISFLTSHHGRRTTLQHPPPTCACAELLVPSSSCNPTQQRRSQASSTSLSSHTTMPTRSRATPVVRCQPSQAPAFKNNSIA